MELSERNGETRGKSRARNRDFRRSLIRNILIISLLCLVLWGAYYYRALAFRTRFFPNTYINNTEVSLKTPEEVKILLGGQLADYRLRIQGRGEMSAFLWGEDVGLTYSFDRSIDELLENQNIFLWFSHLSKDTKMEVPGIAHIDEAKFEAAFFALPFWDSTKTIEPVDAYISPYQEGKGYEIVPEVEGDALSLSRTKEKIREAVTLLAYEVDLEKEGLYEQPSLRKDDPSLLFAVSEANRWVLAEVQYGKIPPLNGAKIQEWIEFTPEGPRLDEEGIDAYVKEIAAAFDTVYRPKDFNTSYGTTVRIDGSSYGWKVNQPEEAKRLKEMILAGESGERIPEFLKRAASLGENDYGTTYVEVNLTAQRMHYYKDGTLVLESDFVSGNPSKGKETPPGIFTIAYKQTDAVLRGEDYEAPVSFWMPFNGDIGFHDATWRERFGYDYYKDSGSRGCINMPFEAAKLLYETMETGCPVICYYLPGTERTRSDGSQLSSGKTSSGGNSARRRNSSHSSAQSGSSSPPAQTTPQTSAQVSTAPQAGGGGNILETSKVATQAPSTKEQIIRNTTAPIGPGALPAPTVPAGPGYRGE